MTHSGDLGGPAHPALNQPAVGAGHTGSLVHLEDQTDTTLHVRVCRLSPLRQSVAPLWRHPGQEHRCGGVRVEVRPGHAFRWRWQSAEALGLGQRAAHTGAGLDLGTGPS